MERRVDAAPGQSSSARRWVLWAFGAPLPALAAVLGMLRPDVFRSLVASEGALLLFWVAGGYALQLVVPLALAFAVQGRSRRAHAFAAAAMLLVFVAVTVPTAALLTFGPIVVAFFRGV